MADTRWKYAFSRAGHVNLFSFGYWGSGNATRQLVRAIDVVEGSRGFEPPLFVDIRMRREGRAAGFVGEAFARFEGPDAESAAIQRASLRLRRERGYDAVKAPTVGVNGQARQP